MWLAFGVLFFLAACVAPRTGRLWFGLFAAWCLAWLPHVVIGVAAVTAGGNAPSVALYKRWGSTSAGSLVLISSAMVLLAHFSLSLVGFGLAARELRRSADPGAGGAG
jgi:cation transporter-like permease